MRILVCALVSISKWMLVYSTLCFLYCQSNPSTFFSSFCYLTAYWGRIIDVHEPPYDGDHATEAKTASPITHSRDMDEPKTVEINGSVLDGWGLEPLPVARFTMIEETQEYDDDDDDDDEAEIFRQSLENYADFDGGGDGRDGNIDVGDDVDPFSSLGDAFQ